MEEAAVLLAVAMKGRTKARSFYHHQCSSLLPLGCKPAKHAWKRERGASLELHLCQAMAYMPCSATETAGTVLWSLEYVAATVTEFPAAAVAAYSCRSCCHKLQPRCCPYHGSG
ncbi:hypothetical protein PIB30_099938 [Stylosanthes scabra]|uniref:Uncharacterized protein n=1 Tax=Stylosanthes scabra TaxID=79078 RepID=A0ABU6VY92_9FABA|nr:hypothetical protein [Stylosanthes scabra]